MNKEILTITIDNIKQKLYFLFNNYGYEFRTYKLTSRLLPKIDDDFTIICKDKNENILEVDSYQNAIEFGYYEDILVIDKKLLEIIDNIIQFLFDYSNNMEFLLEVMKEIIYYLEYDISRRYNIFLHP